MNKRGRKFTAEETRQGVKRLTTRIEQVRSLTDADFDSQRVKNVRSDLIQTIRDVFGDDSPEFEEHKNHRIWRGGYNVGDSHEERQEKFQNGIPETVEMLNGLIARLNENGTEEPDESRGIVGGLKSGMKLDSPYEIYTIERVLGEGGAGRIFLCKVESGETFALKLLRTDAANSTRRKRFKNEIHFCRTVKHANIVPVVDEGFCTVDSTKCPFYVMPVYDGTLRDLIRAGIPLEKKLPYFSKILDGVEAAHKFGVSHRDLKPENILFADKTQSLVVSDFGVADIADELLLTAVETKNSERLANFMYAAPEQRERGKTVTHAADIYALGLILNELFTGIVPHGTDFRRIGDVAPDFGYLDPIVDGMIKQDPASRYGEIADIKNELIARNLSFVSQQKVSHLEKKVIPDGEIDDPLVLSPVKIDHYDYRGRTLIAHLTQAPNAEWIRAFHEEGANSYTSILHYNQVSFHGKEMHVPSDAAQTDQAARMCNEWLKNTTEVYGRRVRQQIERRQREERQILARQIEEEKSRQDVLKRLNRQE